MHLAFGEPLSLAAALREEDSSIPKIAFEVLNRVNGVTPITPAALASLALLDGRERAVTYDEGRALVRPLIEYVDARGLPKVEGIEIGKDTVFRPVLSTLVREGIVTEFAGGTEPVYQIAPDKHVIYPEQMPVSLHRAGGMSRTEQLFAYLRHRSNHRHHHSLLG